MITLIEMRATGETLEWKKSFWLLLALLFLSPAALVSLPAATLNIGALGDSITAGYGNPSQHSWTTDLDTLLDDSAYQYSRVIGESGATLESFVSTHTNGVIVMKGSTDVYVIMLGTNNAKTANQADATANFVTHYKAFIDFILDSNSKNPLIILATPPPAFSNIFGIDPAFVNNDIDAMVTSLQGYRGSKVVDLNDLLMTQFSNDQATYLLDGIHPTPAGDMAIAQQIELALVPEPRSVSLVSAGLFTLAAFKWCFTRKKTSKELTHET